MLGASNATTGSIDEILLHLKGIQNHSTSHSNIKKTLYDLIPYGIGEQVTLDRDHNLMKVLCGDEPVPTLVFDLEGHRGIFLVKVMKKLRELGVGHGTILLFPKVQLDKVRIERKWNGLMKGGLFDDLFKLICKEIRGKMKFSTPSW